MKTIKKDWKIKQKINIETYLKKIKKYQKGKYQKGKYQEAKKSKIIMNKIVF